MGFRTDAIHAGQDPEPATGAVSVPIYQTSTYVQEGLGKHKGYEYARTQNPTRIALEQNMAVLERGVAAYAFASGMAALIMASTDGVFGLRGWQWLFILEGLPSCVLGVVAYRVLSDGPGQAAWLTEAEKAQIAGDLAAEARRGTARHASIFSALGLTAIPGAR